MNEMQVFSFNESEVRTVLINKVSFNIAESDRGPYAVSVKRVQHARTI